MRRLSCESPHSASTLHFSWSRQKCVSSMFCPFKILFISAFFYFAVVLSQWYLGKGQTLRLWEVSAWLCISNSWTHVTTCWTRWTLSALKRRRSECLGVLAWISWDLEQGDRHWWEKNRWMNVEWKRGKMLWWGSTAPGFQHSVATAPVRVGVFTEGCHDLTISMEAWESEDINSALVLACCMTSRKPPWFSCSVSPSCL